MLFGCTRCGECCSQVPIGNIAIKKLEITLELEEQDFVQDCENIKDSCMIRCSGKIFKEVNGYCLFLDTENDREKPCLIYDHRPSKCENYPIGPTCGAGVRVRVI